MKSLFNSLVIILLCMATVCSCSDEESFTTNPSARLTFSSDTISFDTVFTSFGSSTKKLCVFNHNSEAMRLPSIRLASGGKSGFRVNVDGNYGTDFKDTDILRKDSIFVFVEVTVNPNDNDSPILIEDSLIFTLASGQSQRVLLQAYGQDVVILRNLAVTSDTLLDSKRPYVVFDSISVAPSTKLTIAPGATLCFHSGASMLIHGTLDAQGTLEAPITFRGDRTDRMFSYLSYDRLDAQWGGIYIYGESKDNRLNYCDIHSGIYGIYCDSTSIVSDTQKLTLTNSVIHNVAGYGLFMMASNSFVANTQITNAKYDCVALIGGSHEFVHCTIAQFYPWSVNRGNALTFRNIANDSFYPLYKADFSNCIITGYADDELFGTRLDSDESIFNYKFTNCLLCTPESKEEDENIVDCVYEDKDAEAHREKHFIKIDTYDYSYDFQLDSLSTARGIGNTDAAKRFPMDRLGQKRPAEHPDAGCYQREE